MNKETMSRLPCPKEGGERSAIVEDTNAGEFIHGAYIAVSHLCRVAFSTGMRRRRACCCPPQAVGLALERPRSMAQRGLPGGMERSTSARAGTGWSLGGLSGSQ